MSSRFVSGGKMDAETGENVASSAGEGAVTAAPKVNAEWEAVQKELEAERQRREEARKKAVEGGEQSLYDILQANKGK
jgi:NEFA-interacting protein NIP30